MGIFDRFRKTTQTIARVPGTAAPDVPVRATVVTFVVAEALGTLALETGQWLRFGRSACKGFEPAVGAAVIVEEVVCEPLGWSARVVKRDVAEVGNNLRR